MLIADDEVVLSDEDLDKIIEMYSKLKNEKDCEIALIETGDAAFY